MCWPRPRKSAGMYRPRSTSFPAVQRNFLHQVKVLAGPTRFSGWIFRSHANRPSGMRVVLCRVAGAGHSRRSLWTTGLSLSFVGGSTMLRPSEQSDPLAPLADISAQLDRISADIRLAISEGRGSEEAAILGSGGGDSYCTENDCAGCTEYSAPCGENINSVMAGLEDGFAAFTRAFAGLIDHPCTEEIPGCSARQFLGARDEILPPAIRCTPLHIESDD